MERALDAARRGATFARGSRSGCEASIDYVTWSVQGREREDERADDSQRGKEWELLTRLLCFSTHAKVGVFRLFCDLPDLAPRNNRFDIFQRV
jgi:hypothetical protein